MIAADRVVKLWMWNGKRKKARSFSPCLVRKHNFQERQLPLWLQGDRFEDLIWNPQGTVTAIVGESGSGKSTLMALLPKAVSLEFG